MAYNGFWISGRDLQSVLKALIQSSNYENHIASHGGRIYVNGEPVTSIHETSGTGETDLGKDSGRRSQASTLEGIAHLEEPFTDIDTAVRKFKERLHSDGLNY